MSQHTPGPWHITHDTTPGKFVTDTKVRDAERGVVAVMHINSEANARLIAAAPELLEVAKMDQILAFNQVEESARLLVPYGYSGTPLYVELCAFVDHKRTLAILKAEGRKP